jgi:hypothetical protein
VQPDGGSVVVRTVMDFHTIGTLLGAPTASSAAPAGGRLAPSQRAEMVAFFERELRAADWIRALSLADDHANVSSFRPDHGTIGAYDAWPAQAIEALVTLNHSAAALATLRAIASGGAPTEGPLGQARTLFTSDDGTTRTMPPRLCNSSAERLERCVSRKSNHWQMQAYNAAGAAFANTILRTLFGFQPPLPFGPTANASDVALLAPEMPRQFDGVLTNLAWRGKLWSITSSGDGLRMRDGSK